MENEKLYKTLKTMPNIFEKKINELLVRFIIRFTANPNDETLENVISEFKYELEPVEKELNFLMFFTYFTYTLIKITGPRKNKEFAESINKIKTYIKNTKILIKLLKYKLYLSKENKGPVFIQNQYIQMDKIKKFVNILYKAIDRLYYVDIKKHHMIKQKKRISHIIQKN